ncbi:MAG: TatD family hydrolase [Tannerellaceae bacterium]|nr:TatD family hydrolase [Tannerellaceae bacterium]
MCWCDIHTHQTVPATTQTGIVIFNRIIFPDMDLLQIIPSGYYSAGIHPWYIRDIDKQWQLLEMCMPDPRMVAIGEAGLDKLAETGFAIQQEVFKRQAVLAEVSGKPLIIHCVKAWDELLAIRKEIKPRQDWIIHGFRGNGIQASQLVKAGLKLSFGLYFYSEALSIAWPDALFTETDEQEESIQTIYDKIAAALPVSATELALQVRKNVAASFCV